MRVALGSVITVSVLGSVACGSDEAAPLGDATATVTHYDYRFDLDTRAAHTTVTATLDTPGNCVTLPFSAEAPDAATLLVDGAPPTEATAGAGTLKLCGAGRAAGSTITLDVDSTVALATLDDSQVGYSIRMDANQNPFHYLVSWVGGCDRFGPCDDRPDQFATYTFHVTHPATLMVKCSGTITEVSPTETSCDFGFPGGPTYSTFGIAAYPRTAWLATDKGMWGSAQVTVFDRPETGTAAGIDAAYHAGFVSWMESTFGPYPYGAELRILVAPTYWSGFEHPGNIVLDDGLKKTLGSLYANALAHTLDHEIAHQWAGDQTTLAATHDFVWKEAMAEYLAFVYEDTSNPIVGRATANAWKQYSAQAAFFPVPGELPPLFDYYGDVYGPGPMVLFRQLEALTSRDQVIAALKTLLGQPRALSVDDVVAALATSTGLDLGPYAAAWIHGTGAPELARVQLTLTPTTLRVQQTTGLARRCKFHVAVKGAAETEVHLVEVDTFRNGIDQTLTLPALAFTPIATDLDPARECLVYAAPSAREVPHMEGWPHRNPWLSNRGSTSPTP
ncbi:MAG: hypothetical protein H0T79_10915 [Deltaproteobacteria bacterium]|nr:hypothetical protein [Deltaproteobacteria bacterium]